MILNKKKIFSIIILIVYFSFNIFANSFNSKLSKDELNKLNNGELIIRNINFSRNMCLNSDDNNLKKVLVDDIKGLYPKYLAEVIQIRKVKGNEDFPDKLESLLFNIPDYAGIPYYSVRAEEWYNLYDSAEITEIKDEENKRIINANLEMEPFGTINEKFEYYRDGDTILYIGTNQNKLRYYDDFDCVWPKKMKMCILLFKDGENWVLYGIGGVNAPLIPFFKDRIETSFINRIKTFCSYIFSKM